MIALLLLAASLGAVQAPAADLQTAPALPVPRIIPPPVVPTLPPAPAPSAPPQTAGGVPLPPQDWSALPVLRLRRAVAPSLDASTFVQREVLAGRCAGATRTPQGWVLNLDLALLAAADGRVRRVTPRAIDCPTVEQFAAGLLLGAARNNVDLRGAATDSWYRTTMVFAWKA